MSRLVSLWMAVLWSVAALLGMLPTASAQGVLIVEDPSQVIILPRPMPPRPFPPTPEPPIRDTLTYHLSEIDVQVKISDAAAEVQLSQSFVNDGSRLIEAAFVFPLPYDSVITEMTLLVDGKEFAAKVMKSEEARSYYESIMRKNKDPALLEWIGNGLFKTSVFPIPAGAKRTISLKYVQVLRRTDGMTDFIFPLSTARYTTKPVERTNFRIVINSDEEIKNLYSPSHGVKIERPTAKNAIVTFTEENKTPTTDFRLMYDVGRDLLGAKLLSYRPESSDDADGFFALFATPTLHLDRNAQPTPKTVVLVVDRSGSMSGKKIEQARGALRYVLENLRENDLFNIVAYDSRVESFRPELQRLTSETRSEAKGFIESIYAGGSTNIGDALKTAFAPIQDKTRPTYVLFLTDGCPTTGETDESKLLDIAQTVNPNGARLMVFGVGYDVNSRLLDRMAKQGHGMPVYVRPEENIEEQVSSLYRQIESPVLTNVKVEIRLDESDDPAIPLLNRVYPQGEFDLFAGEQMVVVGRYKRSGTAKVCLTGKLGNESKTWEFPAKLASVGDSSCTFVEPLWAMRRVAEILDEMDANGRNDELVKELIELATRHGIVTPYTSFLADENAELGATPSNVARADSRLSNMSVTSGALGVEQRQMRSRLRGQVQAEFTAESFADREVASAMMAGGGGVGGGMGGMAMAPYREYGHDRSTIVGKAAAPVAEAANQVSDTFASASSDSIANTEREVSQAQTTIRKIGERTFYLRNGVWVDGTLSESQQREEHPVTLKQFSTEIFAFVKDHPTLASYLVFDEPVLLNVRGKVYRIEP